jgi:hypothetical protein
MKMQFTQRKISNTKNQFLVYHKVVDKIGFLVYQKLFKSTKKVGIIFLLFKLINFQVIVEIYKVIFAKCVTKASSAKLDRYFYAR